MIHPVLGDALRITSVDDVIYKDKKQISIWPNPASGYITIDADELLLSGDASVTIIDLNGREVKKTILTERIDISSLPAGIYIIITSLNGKPAGYSRLIKLR
ncbi:MAG: T9SS type A sorting domain-containing protein [Bacteroidales bacterium]|nr:T9SS type A sorting domain-containing protein [Bacteroidales bacterium]